MLTPEEWRDWCQRLQLAKETEELLSTIRAGQPVRRVQGRVGNVSGRYPSPKMQRAIQFESQHVELWAIYGMELDDDVLEYYDQPTRIRLQYRSRSGRQTSQWHTPDFLVVRRQGASFEEWKSANNLASLAETMPHRYCQDEQGNWRCPPGEEYAAKLGLTYTVRSSAIYTPAYIQNLKFLQDYWAHPLEVAEEQVAPVMMSVEATPGISVAELLAAHPHVPVDVVWALLASRRLFADLTVVSLMRQDTVTLYRDQVVWRHVKQIAVQAEHPLAVPSYFLWDQRLWQAERVNDTITLQPDIGEALTLPVATFQQLLAEEVLRPVSEATPAPTPPVIRAAFAQLSPASQQAANHRFRQILAYQRGEPISASPRSVQRWKAAYKRAEAEYGCGYLGLVDRTEQRGNRTQRSAEESLQLLETTLKEHYATPIAKEAIAAYRLYCQACEQRGLQPVSERTFYRIRTRFTTTSVIAARSGQRAAYQRQPFVWYLEHTTPRHGDRPFAIAHLDHTELDLLLVSSITGKPLARPWASLLMDAYSRRILAVYVSYDPPSYRSAMMVFRVCVQRYQRLPQELVVDRGPEFGSVYFETLLTRYGITKKERPPIRPRYGSLIERVFGTTNSELLHQLRGNTQATKQARTMTREVNPKQHALWTLDDFAKLLSQWLYEIYDQLQHPALSMTPRDTFIHGIQAAGIRQHRVIPYSEEFVMLTRPAVRAGTAKIHPSQGITVHNLHYWNEMMRLPHIANTKVPVRFEPYDMGIVYAFIDGQWVECIADTFTLVHGRTEREWQTILEEWRKHQHQHSIKRLSINGPLLAQFLQEIEQNERVFLQRQRDMEAASVRNTILGDIRFTSQQRAEIAPHVPHDDGDLDLSSIPQYGAY